MSEKTQNTQVEEGQVKDFDRQILLSYDIYNHI
jgi:hypothetical protein